MLTEDKIISQFQKPFASHLHHLTGIGDDAAVIPKNEKESYIISKDLLIENVHFRLSYFDPKALAHKAIHSNLSDIAAMGAKAKYIFLGLALPPTIETAWMEAFQKHFSEICLKENILLLGGDTNRSPHELMLSITIIGEGENNAFKLRSTAKEGDKLCVVGALGEAFAGFTCLENKIAGFSNLTQKTLFPQALAQEGAWLGKQSAVTAMMDISDGLFLDSQKLCHASQKGAHIDLTHYKASQVLQDFCHKNNLNLVDILLAGGEDYALLCTVAPSSVAELKNRFEKAFITPFTEIGEITKAQKVEFYFQNQILQLKLEPFVHFLKRRV